MVLAIAKSAEAVNKPSRLDIMAYQNTNKKTMKNICESPFYNTSIKANIKIII